MHQGAGDTVALDPVSRQWLEAPSSERLTWIAGSAGTPYGFIVFGVRPSDARSGTADDYGGFILRPAE
jgi:hypothetical protein